MIVIREAHSGLSLILASAAWQSFGDISTTLKLRKGKLGRNQEGSTLATTHIHKSKLLEIDAEARNRRCKSGWRNPIICSCVHAGEGCALHIRAGIISASICAIPQIEWVGRLRRQWKSYDRSFDECSAKGPAETVAL